MSDFSARAASRKSRCGRSLEHDGRHVRQLSRYLALKALQPLDGRGFADRVMTTRRSAAHLSPLHRLDHPVAQILRIRLCHFLLASAQPAGKSKSRQFGNLRGFCEVRDMIFGEAQERTSLKPD